MKKFSILRISIIIFLVPFCVYLFYIVFSHTRKPDQQDIVKDDQDNRSVTKIEKFEMKGLEQERTAFHLNAEKFIQAEEGIFKLEKIDSLILHAGDGRRITISADRGTMIDRGESDRQITADGNVFLFLDDGTQIQAQKLVYDQKNQNVRTESGVLLKKGNIKASASAMHYDLDKKQISLSPEFVMEVAGKDILTARSGSFTGKLDIREGILSGGVNISNSRSRVIAAQASFLADDNGEKIDSLVLSGGVNGRANLEHQGRTFYGTFRSDSAEISFESNDISVLDLIQSVSLAFQDSEIQPSSVRSLMCERFTMRKIDEDLSKAEISGHVAISILGKGAEGSEENLSCDALNLLVFQGKKIESAHAEGNVLYTSSQMIAACEAADFKGSDSQITMLESGKKRPSVQMEDWEVHARRIELKNGSEMIASDEVKSSYMNKSGRKDALPLFESDKILFIASDRLSVRQKNDVLYSGNVRAWQEENSISARELAIDLGGKRVEARADVISRFQNMASLKSSDTEEDPEKQSSSQKAEVHSDSLIYSSEESRALYSGHVVAKMEDREISCGELQIQLSREGKAKKMLAQNDVMLKTSGYSSTGEKLEYDLSERHAVMHGNAEPAKVYNDQGKEMVVAPSLTFHMSDDKMTLISRDGGRTWITLEPIP